MLLTLLKTRIMSIEEKLKSKKKGAGKRIRRRRQNVQESVISPIKELLGYRIQIAGMWRTIKRQKGSSPALEKRPKTKKTIEKYKKVEEITKRPSGRRKLWEEAMEAGVEIEDLQKIEKTREEKLEEKISPKEEAWERRIYKKPKYDWQSSFENEEKAVKYLIEKMGIKPGAPLIGLIRWYFKSGRFLTDTWTEDELRNAWIGKKFDKMFSVLMRIHKNYTNQWKFNLKLLKTETKKITTKIKSLGKKIKQG